MLLWTAFITGLVGSLHCVGMCGPIAMALPTGFKGRLAMLSSRLMYNFGRIFTYSLLGAIFGLFGQGIALAGLQQGLSILLGIGLLAMAFFSFRLESRFMSFPALERMMGRLRATLGRLLKRNTHSSLLAIGLLNGLLPCGFVYLALAGALSTGNAWDSMAYMALFGLGTLPLMLATSILGSLFSAKIKSRFRPVLLAFTLIFALLLIVRGLNLGSPFSPNISGPPNEVVNCE